MPYRRCVREDRRLSGVLSEEDCCVVSRFAATDELVEAVVEVKDGACVEELRGVLDSEDILQSKRRLRASGL